MEKTKLPHAHWRKESENDSDGENNSTVAPAPVQRQPSRHDQNSDITLLALIWPFHAWYSLKSTYIVHPPVPSRASRGVMIDIDHYKSTSPDRALELELAIVSPFSL